jgi:hypothetical protein
MPADVVDWPPAKAAKPARAQAVADRRGEHSCTVRPGSLADRLGLIDYQGGDSVLREVEFESDVLEVGREVEVLIGGQCQ